MSDFDFNAYLDKKLSDPTFQAKIERVTGSSADKEARLNRIAQERAAQENSWAGRLGLDTDGFLGARVNDAASFVSGASRVAGHVVSLAPNGLAMLQDTIANEDDVAALEYLRQGKATSEEKRRAHLLQGSANLRAAGRATNNFFDLTNIVDQTNRNQLNADLGADFEENWGKVTGGWKNGRPTEVVSGVASLLMNAGQAAFSNPAAAKEYILENLPQLFVGAVGKAGQAAMLASNVGYAADEYQKGIENYQRENGGALPPEEQRNRMALMAASLALAEHAGDKALLGMGKVKKALGGAVDASEDTVTKGFKAALANVGKATAGGTLTEAVTEGYQTYAEGEVEGKPASAKDIYTGAVIGGIAGGGLSGGARAVAEATGATPEKVAAKVQEQVKEVETKEAVKQAVEAGDPEVFLDRKSKQYNPAKAIAVMQTLAEQEGTTEEQFKTHLAKAAEVVERLEAQRDTLDPKKLQASITELQDEVKNTDPADTDTIADLTMEIEAMQDQLTDMTEGKNKVSYGNQLKVVQNQLKEAEAAFAGFTRAAVPAPTVQEVADQLELANDADTEVAFKAGEALINLSMTAPHDLSPDAALTVANNMDNGLDERQRELLRKFSEARVAENALKDLSTVSKEILYGSERYVGITQYRDRIAQAVKTGNEGRATRQLKQLGEFVADHTAKLHIAETAPQPSQIIKVGNNWEVNKGKRLSDAKLKENGGFNIHHNSTKLVDQFSKEVEALTKAHAQLQEAVGLRFGKAPVESSVQTPAVPQNSTPSPVSPASLFREKREREARKEEGKPSTSPESEKNVSEKPQKEKKVQEVSEPISAVVSPQTSTISPSSPAATPAASVAVAPSLQDASARQETQQTVPDATEQPVEAVAETPAAEVATAPVGEQGRLSVMAGHVKDSAQTVADMFTDKVFNPVAQFITQKSTNESYKTVRPLVRIQNFLSKLSDGTIENFTGLLGKEPDEAQLDAIEDFRQKASKWVGFIKTNIGDPSTKEADFDFRFRDMMQYLVTRDGETLKVDENLLVGIAYGGYHWAVDTAGSQKMSNEKINAMFGRDEDAHVQSAIWQHIKGMDNFEDTTINSIGDVIVQALGLTAREDAPQDIMPRIKTALGAHALLMLEDAKLLERKAIKRSAIVDNLEYLPGENNTNESAELMFVFPDYDGLKSYKELNKGTSNVVDKLFAADPGPTFATTEPVKFRQQYAQHTRQEIPEVQRKAMERLHKTPHTVIPEMLMTLKGLGADNILRIAGVRDVEADHVHMANIRSVEAQNDNLMLQLELMLDMLGVQDLDNLTDDQINALSKTEYFVQGEVWKNFRAGILTRSLNQQTSKIHRYMFARPNWTAKVDLTNADQRLDLEVAIAAGLGIKTDEQTNEETAELLREKFAKDEALRTAVDSMHIGLTTGKWDNIYVITDYAASNEGMMTLQTLVAYAKYLNAPQDQKVLEVTMLVGADGKTNGPILTHLALGAAEDVNGLLTMMERGGMYANEDGKALHYSEARKNGLKDLYEDLASELVKNIKPSAEMTALQAIIGELTKKDGSVSKHGRNLVKTPLTAFAFGSSLEGSILAMENKFIASIYDKIEDLSANNGDVKAFVQSLNTLLLAGDPKATPTQENISIKALMSQELSKEDELALRKAFQKLMAAPVKETMESYFAVFIQRRTDLNLTIGSAYAVYREAYAAKKKALIAKLIEEGKMAYRIQKGGTEATGKGQKLPLHGLTVQQERELRESVKDLLPVAHTAYSVGGDLSQGIYMAKTDAVMSKDALHFTQVNVGRPVKQAGNKGDGKTLKTYTMVREETDPGVAGTPYFIHSLDSANMHMALLDVDQSMNVHDEIGNGPLSIKRAAGAINRATVQNLLKFSPAREALNMLERMVVAMAKGVEDGTVSKEAVGNLLASWQDAQHKRLIKLAGDPKMKRPDAYKAAKLTFGMALDNAVRADKLRLGTIAKLGAVDQYVWEGGHFTDLGDIRKQAQEQLDNLPTKMSPEAAKAMEAIFAFYRGETPSTAVPVTAPVEIPAAKAIGGAVAATVVGKSVTTDTINTMEAGERAETIQKVARVEAALPGTGMTPFGLLGKPTHSVDAIHAAFQAKPVMNRQEVVSLLAKNLPNGYRTILTAAAKGLPENLRVEMITPDTDPATVTNKTHENSRGWFVPTKDGGNTIYVLSNDFVHSGMNGETLLHELVHAATARELLNPSDKSSKSLRSDLETLLEHLRQQEGAKRFDHILQGENALHELVAWGMSNKEFQGWLANTKSSHSKTTRNKLVTAWKQFVRALTGGAYPDSALETLLRNTSGLFEAAAKNTSAIELNLSQIAAPQTYTTEEIFDALASEVRPTPEADTARLKALMLTMVDKLSPVYGVFGPDMQSKTLSAASVFAAAQKGGVAPFASDAIANGMGYNEQVAFMLEQVEVTIRTAISGNDGNTSLAYRELMKLYNEAATKLKGKMDAADYDFVFKMEAGNDDRSDYLARFAALGLVHPEVNALLKFDTDAAPSPTVGMGFTERLSAVFNQILEWFAGKWTKTYSGQQADTKLDALATQLVLLEAKRRARLNVAQNATAANLEETFRGVADKARDKVDEWVNSDLIKNSPHNIVRAVGSVTSLAVKDRLEYLGLAYQTFSDTHFKDAQGTIGGIINELQGSKDDNRVFYKLLRMTKFLEGKRKDIITNTTKVVLGSFINGGKNLTDAGKKAISSVMLRTDMSSLLDKHGLDGLLSMMKDKAALAKAMHETEQELASTDHQLFYINAAEAMGYQMATGDAGMDHTLLNAYAIARLHGTDQMSRVTEEQAAKAQPIIDRLASLYALQHASHVDMQEAVKVFEAEMARTDGGNGVELVLRLHQKLQQESKERLFKEQEALMTKGYTPEIYNHYIEVTTADASQAIEMKNLGYGKGMKLSKDQHDPETQGDKLLFARHGSGLLPYNSGAFSTTAMKTKGSTKHNGNMDLFSEKGQYNVLMMTEIQKAKADAIKTMFKRRVHPGVTNQSFMVPVLNPSGEVVNYRYMMKNRTKDTVLERDNRFEHLLGAMAGSIFDKQSSPKQNRVLVEALKAQYDAEAKDRPMSYIEVGPRSPNPQLRETYRLLPESTKMAIREVWKSDSMMVRIDLLDINFGYRKKSLTDVFNTEPDAREGLTKFMAEFLGLIGGFKMPMETEDQRKHREAKAAIRVRNAEEIWQTFVREAKDMIVVKSGSTLMGNVMSNFSLLYAYGVPVTDMMRNHRIALRGALEYKKNSDELFELQTKLDTGTTSDVETTKRRIVQLKDAIARNPVRHLIDAGLMPTIVEDVEVDDDIYSYKSRFVKKLNEYTEKVNPYVLEVGKTLYMTHDTKLYKGMSQAAQLSDFLARYTLYQHMTTRKRDPMSSEDAIQMASDAFINYDVPTHRNMQYANDMGLIRFTKYYLRIQKVILHLYRDNPARMLSLMAMDHYFSTLPTVLDSAMFARIGNNPLEWGAMEYLFSFDDLATSKAVLAPF